MLGTKIFTYLKKHQKTFLYVAFFAAIFFFFTDLAFANEWANANTQQKDSNPADWFNAFVQVIATGIGMLTNVVGLFLNPGWTNATGIGLHTHLKELWIMISNIVYVIFAFLLIVIAFMNIIGKWDKWELKQALPRFVIWVLIVPFSWLFVQVLIAFSSFLSVSVLMLPYEVLSNSPTSEWDTLKTKPVCTTYVVVSAKSEDSDNTKDPAPWFCWNAQPIWELMSSNGIYGLLNIYTFGIFSLDELSKINGKEVDTLTSIFKVGINGIVILLLAIVYFILIVSLCLALFVRWVWLWLYMIFSPVFWLLYFFDKGKDGFIEWKFSISEFISLAMVPVYVSAALAFGLLFIFVSWSAFTGQWETSGFLKFEMLGNGNDPKYTTGSSTNQSRVSSLTGSRITVLDEFKLDMYWDFGTSGKNAEWVFDVMKSGFGTLLMQLFGLAVLWIAVMAAINQSKITQAVVEPIAAFGKQVGGLIQKAPQYTPVFPGGQSMSSMNTAAWSVSSSIQSAQNTKWTNFANKHFWKIMWDEKESEYRTIGASVPSHIDQTLENISKLNKVWNTNDIANSKTAIEAYVRNLEKLLSQGWFKDKKEAQKAIDLLKSSQWSPVKVDEALTKLDDLWVVWRTILWGEDVAAKGSANEYLWAKATWYVDNGQFRPLNENIDVTLYSDGSDRQIYKIDHNTSLTLWSDNSLDQTNIKRLVSHLVDDSKIKTMKESEILPWLEKNNIWKDDDNRKEIITAIEEAINKLKDSDGNKINKKDYFIDESNEKKPK